MKPHTHSQGSSKDTGDREGAGTWGHKARPAASLRRVHQDRPPPPRPRPGVHRTGSQMPEACCCPQTWALTGAGLCGGALPPPPSSRAHTSCPEAPTSQPFALSLSQAPTGEPGGREAAASAGMDTAPGAEREAGQQGGVHSYREGPQESG